MTVFKGSWQKSEIRRQKTLFAAGAAFWPASPESASAGRWRAGSRDGGVIAQAEDDRQNRLNRLNRPNWRNWLNQQ
ncbi:MAG: hypothetical protein PVH35_11675 [Syntrophobacterales bacterium]